MSNSTQSITVPQLGVNDDQAELIQWHINNGSRAQAGELLCTLETTKAIYELEMPLSGYVAHCVKENERVSVNQEIAIICATQEESAQVRKNIFSNNEQIKLQSGISDINATNKAIKIAQEHALDLSSIAPCQGSIIRESDVLKFIKSQQDDKPLPINTALAKDFIPVAIYGAGNGAITLMEAMNAGTQYRAICFIDDAPSHANNHHGLPVISGSDLDQLKEQGIQYIATEIARGSIRQRIKLKIEKYGFELVNIIHPSAFISPSVKLGVGNFIKAGAIIETNTIIGDSCIIDNSTTIAHDNLIGDACHIAPGAVFGSSIKVGENTVIGIGANISTNVTIGHHCIISVGAAVTKNIDDHCVVDGVPAKIIGKTKSI